MISRDYLPATGLGITQIMGYCTLMCSAWKVGYS